MRRALEEFGPNSNVFKQWSKIHRDFKGTIDGQRMTMQLRGNGGNTSSDEYAYPVAVSRLSKGERSREPQNQRAIKWLLDQPGGSVVVVTPRKPLESPSIKRLVATSGVDHRTWKGCSAGSLANHRVLYAWPDRRRLNELWGVEIDALAVIEWGESEIAEWIKRVNPVQLVEGDVVEVTHDSGDEQPSCSSLGGCEHSR